MDTIDDLFENNNAQEEVKTKEDNLPTARSYSWDETNEKTDEYIEDYIKDVGQEIVCKDDILNLGLTIDKMKEKDIQRLVNTIAYFRLVNLQRKRKSEAYNIAFRKNDRSAVASAKANAVERGNTFKMVSRYMGLDLNLTFMTDRLSVLSKLAQTALSDDVHPRDAVSASEVFLKYTDVMVDETEERASKAVEVLADLINKVDKKREIEVEELKGMSVEDIIDVEE